MDRILYIVEGEIEIRFFDFLTKNNLIQPGKRKLFNLMQERLLYTNDIFTKKEWKKIFAVLDTDRVDKCNIETLTYNVSMLKKICARHLYLLIQNKNFEDELQYMLSCRSLQSLAQALECRHHSRHDIKTFLSQTVRYSGLISIEHLQRYCKRQDTFTNMISESLRHLCVSIDSCLSQKNRHHENINKGRKNVHRGT